MPDDSGRKGRGYMKRPIAAAVLFLLAGTSLIAQEQEDALAAYRAGSYLEAVRICLVELESMPRNMNSYSVLGWSLIALGRHQEALDYAERAQEVSPRDPRIIEILGEAHYFLGNTIDALDYFEEYTVLAPTGDRIENAYFFMGEIFIRLQEYHHADIALSTAVHHAPNISTWWARLGYAREMAGDSVFALEAYTRSLTLNPGLTEASRGRGRIRSAVAGP
jgi:tetratricopeptide (TPR) repeat protein